MGFNIFRFLSAKDKRSEKDITIEDLCAEYKKCLAQSVAFEVCEQMIANAIGRCDFRTFVNFKETLGSEHYLWNFNPNSHQNSTEFLHKLIYILFHKNEALIIESGSKNSELLIADSFEKKETGIGQYTYTSVTVGNHTFNKTFREKDVLHFKNRNKSVKNLADSITLELNELLSHAENYYHKTHGRQMKVHIDSVASGEENFQQNFMEFINKQVKPFMDGVNTILPEFDGYKYEDLKIGSSTDSVDIRNLYEEIFNETAKVFLIPSVLVNGKVESTSDANARFLSTCIDPICDMMSEEITRKRYGFENWTNGDFMRVDSSSILHFDIFANAANVEKLVGSGAFTINDVLRAAGQPTIRESWADEHYMTLNIEKLDNSVRNVSQAKGGNDK